MKYKFFFFLFFLINLNSLFSESLQIDGSKDIYRIGSYLYYLEDKDGKLSFDEIQKPETIAKFQKSENDTPNFGYTTSAYWFYLEYESNVDWKDYLLEVAYPVLDKLDLYYINSQEKIISKKTGDNYAFAEREFEHRNFLFSIGDLKNKGILVFRMQTAGALQIPVFIYKQKFFWGKEQFSLSIQMVFVGIMLAMILYNFLLGFSLRDKTYFYYVFYLISITLYITASNGLNYQFLWRNWTYWNQNSNPLFVLLTNLSATIFLIYFLKLKKNLPFIYKIFRILVYINIIVIFSTVYISYALAGKLAVLLALTTSIISFFVAAIVSIRGYRPAKIYLFAWTIFLIGVIMIVLNRYAILPVNFFTENSLQIGAALESILISFALADRIKLLQREKDKAQLESIESMKKADRLKDEFLANTSHELRTPLNGIIGLSESLLDGIAGNLSIKAKENLSLIITSGKRLSSLVNDILDFSKMKHKELDLNLKPVDLYSSANLVIALSNHFTRGKELKLINSIPNEFPMVYADENRLQQILYNLIGNSIKFTEAGFITIEVNLKEQRAMAEITISDTGIGIPGDKLDSIFESFEQVDSSTARKYGGTGLGLTITKQLVELQGGKIRVESKINHGSKFIFTLPITDEKISQKPSDPEIQRIISEPEIDMDTQEENDLDDSFHVLAVDDEQINLQVLSNQLKLAGYKISLKASGKETLEFLEDSANKPDLLLLDVMMPQMTGFQVCQKIRETYKTNELPVIFLTAKNRINDLIEGFHSGGNDFITKPFEKKELLARIKTHLELYKITTELALLNANLETKVEERTRDLNEALVKVSNLKEQQDADYFLNTLLIEPLGKNNAISKNISIEFFIKQKKQFIFRKEEYELGGDINISEVIELQEKRFIVFLNGDAMGKSIQGAGGVLVLGAVFKSIIQRTNLKKGGNQDLPEKWMKNTFIEIHRVFESFDCSMLMSMVLGLIDEATGVLYYINAEHPSIVLYRDGRAHFIKNEMYYTKLGTLFQEGEISVSRFQLLSEDIVLCGSDGRDDLILGVDPETNLDILNYDEGLFLEIVNDAKAEIPRIFESIQSRGKIIDDLSLLKITYLGK